MNIKNCIGCHKTFKKKSKSGYCGECFHANVNGVKSQYFKARWQSGVAKIENWKYRGAKITSDDLAIYELQEKCELCDKKFTNDKCMDHDHETGLYRGALCRQCNAALGKLGDNIDNIIEKLQRYKSSKGR